MSVQRQTHENLETKSLQNIDGTRSSCGSNFEN